jgi:hypothetical protein
MLIVCRETTTVKISPEHIRDVLDYDPNTGKFYWRKKVAQRVKIGDQTGSRHHSGYLSIFMLGRSHRAHRLAWLHYYGEQPPKFIDHINGVRDDNRIDNLRAATAEMNAHNRRRAQKGSESGLLGVARNGNNWQAYIRVQKKPVYLGTFKTPEEAHQVYIAAKRKFHAACTL